jgi:hypothetical protein
VELYVHSPNTSSWHSASLSSGYIFKEWNLVDVKLTGGLFNYTSSTVVTLITLYFLVLQWFKKTPRKIYEILGSSHPVGMPSDC